MVFSTPAAWWKSFGVIALFLFVVQSILYAMKCILYPRKVAHEWTCPGDSLLLTRLCPTTLLTLFYPVRGPFFSTVPINVLIFSFLAYDIDTTLSKVLFVRISCKREGTSN